MSSDDHSRESLSVVLDSEASELELRRVLNQLDQEPDLREQAIRYELIGSVIRREHNEYSHIDISGAVRSQLGKQPMAPVSSDGGRWLKPAGKFAVAASVMAAVLVGVNSYNRASLGELDAVLADATGLPALTEGAPVGAGSWLASMPISGHDLEVQTNGEQAGQDTLSSYHQQQRLQGYMMQHAEQALYSVQPGMVHFARVANIEAR